MLKVFHETINASKVNFNAISKNILLWCSFFCATIKAVNILVFQRGAWLPASGGSGDASVEGSGAAGIGAKLSSAGLSSSTPAGLSTGPPDGQEEPQEMLLVSLNTLLAGREIISQQGWFSNQPQASSLPGPVSRHIICYMTRSPYLLSFFKASSVIFTEGKFFYQD